MYAYCMIIWCSSMLFLILQCEQICILIRFFIVIFVMVYDKTNT